MKYMIGEVETILLLILLLWDSDGDEGQPIRLVCDFVDDRWTRNRSITAVDWSLKVRISPLFDNRPRTDYLCVESGSFPN